jgi:hemerythrin-like domain-containing protein
MNHSPAIERIGRETLEEHRQIHFYLDQIGRTLETLTPGRSAAEPMQRLVAQLGGLKEQLAEHYQAEQTGLFRAILDFLPECKVEIERLRGEHAKMIEILELARIHAQEGGAGEAADLRDDLEGFLELFRRHESQEERLLQRARSAQPRRG